jgi:hypothetical protein
VVPSNHAWSFQSRFAGPDNENPVAATTIPITVTPSNATNFKNMSMSFNRVPIRVETQFKNVTSASPTSATDLSTQIFTVSASAPMKARTRYSPMMMEIIAALPGFSTSTATHVNKNPANSPKILDR